MTTPSHLLYNLALLGKKGERNINMAVVFGAIFPDSAVWVFFLIMGVLKNTPHQILWGDMYFNSWWNHIFNLFHSFWLLPLLLVISLYFKKRVLAYFFGSALLHAVTDFFVHARDAYAHFWPFSEWRFHSPISYWDRNYYGDYVGVLEFALCVIAAYVIYKRVDTKKWQYVMLVVMALEVGMVAMGVGRLL